ncbi:MAG TPA: hypothetical protein VE907_03190, partial [Gammaproteobacteria bacterium]|nr:hypothetical protein [Gammaproteobacteria bacterium]
NTDSATGTFPSAQFMALSLFGLGAWSFDPNMLAMGVEIDKGCSSPRTKKIRENLVKLLDERIEWHATDHRANVGVHAQRTVRVTAQAYQKAVEQSVPLPVRDAAIRQLAALEARGAQLVECEYGPMNPDSTGFQTITFWHGSAPLTMNDLQKISRRHPLGDLGDDAVNACPPSLGEAGRALRASRARGTARLDQSALAADALSLDQAMGDMRDLYRQTRAAWLDSRAAPDPRVEQQAVIGKSKLVKMSGDACAFQRKTGVPPPGLDWCAVDGQLRYDLGPIPDAPPEGVVLITDTLPNGLALTISTLEPIDLLSLDETRRYKAELSEPSMFRGVIMLPKGTPLTLTLVRAPQAPPNQVIAKMTVDTITLNGAPKSVRSPAGIYPTFADPKKARPLPPHTIIRVALQASN